MTNILFINHTTHTHGAETVMLQIIERVFNESERHRVHVLEPKEDNESLFKKELDKLSIGKYLSLPYKNLGGSFFRSLIVVFFNMYTTLKLINYVKRNKIDMIYSNTSIAVVGIITAILTQKPHVWHFHEPIEPTHGWYDSLVFFYKILLPYKKNITIFVSETQKKQWKNKLKLPFDKSKTIYNPIKEIDLLNRKSFEPNIFFGYMGSWEIRKNILFLLKCFACLLPQYPDIKLILAKNTGNNEKQIIEYIKTLNLSDHIIMKQYDDASEFYADIDLLVLPSLSETWGMVVLEAMSVKKPAIITNNTGIRELFEDGKDCLFINPLDENTLLEAMKKMIDAGFREKIAGNGYNKLNSYDFNNKFVSEFNNIWACI